ncbi:MAG: hypothetical protein HFH09_00655 [Bacilli bacterium]|nr:hypothetical protein [Bacilli bacterium]
MKLDFTGMKFNNIEDIDQLIEAIEKMPENSNKQNAYMKAEVTRRTKMLEALRELRKEADEIAKEEKEKQEAEEVRAENDEIEKALERAKQLIKTKKMEVSTPVCKKSSSYYGGESRSSSHYSWGYSSGESRGESRW